MITNITLIGTGLIGSSLGLALRRGNPEMTITGYDQPEVLRIAKNRGAIQKIADSISEAVGDADVVIVATPLSAALLVMEEMSPYLKPGAIVSDVSSVKRPIQSAAKHFLPASVKFVGGHPMAGSEKSGPEHADEFLFENSTYVLCPDDDVITDRFESEYDDFLSLLRSTGARIMLLTAESHDRIAASISHLPQLLAVGLVHFASDSSGSDPELLQLAAGGFRDMTRIASSPYTMWEQILSANADKVKDALEQYITLLKEIKDSLTGENPTGAGSFFESAEKTRGAIPKKTKGFLRPLADVFVFITDEPGAIHRMTGVLTDARINIKDIELLKIREGTGGTFRIGLNSDAEAEHALNVLGDAEFKAHRLK